MRLSCWVGPCPGKRLQNTCQNMTLLRLPLLLLRLLLLLLRLLLLLLRLLLQPCCLLLHTRPPLVGP